MVKKTASFSISDFKVFRNKMLNWVKPFNIFCLLDNSEYAFSQPAFECLLAAGAASQLTASAGNALEQLKQFQHKHRDWLFGHFAYDLKNEIEELTSVNKDDIGFPDLCFFVPEIVIQLEKDMVTISCEGEPATLFREIAETSMPGSPSHAPLSIRHRITKEEYLHAIREIQRHILRGDCYELNFCQEFYATAWIDPLAVYQQLMAFSPHPFASLYRLNRRYCICASPERYLQKKGNILRSQPMKGTSRRDLYDQESDEINRRYLLSSEKEKSENVMVVDLVRNDLSKVCKKGSVQVEELFGIYSFPQVHQMISTVSGEIKASADITDIIRATFPMGSMTGAPKKKVMQLIDQYERTRRGLFSGSIGYIDPSGDMDFNVVIRSILYNSDTHYLSFQTGSAITFYSDAEKEYEESLLKASALIKALQA